MKWRSLFSCNQGLTLFFLQSTSTSSNCYFHPRFQNRKFSAILVYFSSQKNNNFENWIFQSSLQPLILLSLYWLLLCIHNSRLQYSLWLFQVPRGWILLILWPSDFPSRTIIQPTLILYPYTRNYFNFNGLSSFMLPIGWTCSIMDSIKFPLAQAFSLNYPYALPTLWFYKKQ